MQDILAVHISDMITWRGCPVSVNDGQRPESKVSICFSSEEQQDHYNAAFPAKNFGLSKAAIYNYSSVPIGCIA